jgi:hypothetical protein
VAFPQLSVDELIEWRLGMPALAPFVAGLGAGARADLIGDARCRLAPAPPVLVRSFITITWKKPD